MVDKRTALPSGTELPFPGMTCLIECEVGRGSNSIVYKGKYLDNLNTREWHTVLIKELFPLHSRGAIRREKNGSLLCDSEGEELWQIHLRSFEYGNRVHLRMLEHFPSEIGNNINTHPLHNTWYSILEYSGGRSLEEDECRGRLSLRQLAVKLLRLLDSLACFHVQGYLHLDISPANILLLGSDKFERVMLIDFNSVHSIQQNKDDPGIFSTTPGFSAPEIINGYYEDVCAASDLYSVAAVFYWLLNGSSMTTAQRSRAVLPDISRTLPLQNQPDTVLRMAEQILRKGLNVLPRKRYQSVEEMRLDVQELIDRIDKRGITHSALWEGGRRAVRKAIWDNPAYDYLRKETDFFEVHVQRSDGAVQPVGHCLSSLKEQDGCSLQLVGEGGAGKSTALLRFVLSSQERYSPEEPAVMYLSLYGRKNTKARLTDFILENLYFSEDANDFPAARQVLHRLLETPLQTRRGKLPTLVLLLDGLNEYEGPKDTLFEDLQELSRLKGVRFLVSSRAVEERIPVEHVQLIGLQADEVRRVFSLKGLAMPESQEMRELLRNPLMLSIFLQSAEILDSQLLISGQDELLEVYFSSLLSKERRMLPEDSGEYWLLEASVRFALPAIAEEIRRRKRPLNYYELLLLFEKLFALTGSDAFFQLFPNWTGHSPEIRAGAETAEQWFGLVAHRILWKRLALLICLEHGDQKMYQLPHALMVDYQSAVYRAYKKELRKGKLKRTVDMVLLRAPRIGSAFKLSQPESEPVPYQADIAEVVLAFGDTAYRFASQRAQALSELTDAADSSESCGKALLAYERTMDAITTRADASFHNSEGGTDNSPAANAVAALLDSGEVFSDSKNALNEQDYWALITYEEKLRLDYAPLVETLSLLFSDERLVSRYGDIFRRQLKTLTDADAEMTGLLYHLTIVPNAKELLKTDTSFSKAHYTSAYQSAHDPVSLFDEDLQLRLLDLRSLRETNRSDAQGSADAIHYLAEYYTLQGM